MPVTSIAVAVPSSSSTPPFIAPSIGLVSSSFLSVLDILSSIFLPSGELWSGSSLKSEYIITHGWFLSLFTIVLTCSKTSGLDSKFLFSSSTSIPYLSQASRISFAGFP